MTEYEIRRLECIGNRKNFTPEYSFISNLQDGILKLAAEVRRLKGLPAEQATDDDEDEDD